MTRRRVLNDIQVKEIRAMYKPYVFGYGRIAKIYGVGESTIRDIIKYWGHFMKTNVSQSSINTYHVIGELTHDQNGKVLSKMEVGKAYTRRELGVMAGIENSAAARVVNCLVKFGDLIECGEKRCSISLRNVGAVTLSLAVE